MDFLLYLIKVFWLFLPAGIANIAPPLTKKINFLAVPIDFGKKLKGRALFGAHKTFRGFFFGIIASMIVIYLQFLSYEYTKNISMIDYNNTNIILLGFMFGFGALFGDLIESFFKRQFNIRPGKPWIPFDQIDWIIGSIIFASFIIDISLVTSIIAIIVYGLIHPIVNHIGYFLHLQNNRI